MTDHYLMGCRTRAIHQFNRASDFVTLVSPTLSTSDNDARRQFLYQSIIVMVHSFYEEYLRCVISLSSIWKAPALREHLATCLPDRALEISAMPAARIGELAQGRLSFEQRAAKLKALMQVICGSAPFADQQNEDTCLDFVLVRNIIVHRGGWPDAEAATQIVTPGVIVDTGSVGSTHFHQLVIGHEFFHNAFGAVGQSLRTIEQALAIDPILSHHS